MRILTLHSNSIVVKPTKKAIKDADEDVGALDAKEALVVFTSVEKEDEKNAAVVDKAVAEILKVNEQVKAKEIVIYPYVHLTSSPSSPTFARATLAKIAESLQHKGNIVKKAPFGWYKAFNIDVKGHPLAELSREIREGAEAPKKIQTKVGRATKRSEKELEEYAEHDHRRIGKDLDLFSFHDFAPGQPFLHQKGLIIVDELKKLMGEELAKRGYQRVSAPILWSQEIYEKGGHWQNYRENMFVIDVDGRGFAPKPMNCPGHAAIFKTRTRSYKDLPIRIAEWTTLYRNELSGVLSGLFRVMGITQDDAHIYCKEDQIESEIVGILDLMNKIYNIFGLTYKAELSTKPEKHIGSDELWSKAESILEKILKKHKIEYKINAGDGAFYGPKIDIHLKDSLGRTWQCATIQLDFNHAQCFDVAYVDADSKEQRPVVIHRTIYGSFERFLGVIIEHYKGNLPTWLSPIHVIVLPIGEKNGPYAKKINDELARAGLRTELWEENTLDYRIRNAQLQKVPYMLVVGDKEEAAKTVAVRTRDGKTKYGVKIDEFLKDTQMEIAERR